MEEEEEEEKKKKGLERRKIKLKKGNLRGVWHGRDKRKEKAVFGKRESWVGKKMGFLGSKGFIFSLVSVCCGGAAPAAAVNQ